MWRRTLVASGAQLSRVARHSANNPDGCPTLWYVDRMGVRIYAPSDIEIVPTRLADGRVGGSILLPIDDEEFVELKLSLPLLGQLTAAASEIRDSAPAWA